MKTKFTKRSEKDGTLVTMPLSQFTNEDDSCYVSRYWVSEGDEITVVVDGIPTVFICARPDKTGAPTVAVSRGYPRHLRLPRVGRPVYAEVTEIR